MTKKIPEFAKIQPTDFDKENKLPNVPELQQTNEQIKNNLELTSAYWEETFDLELLHSLISNYLALSADERKDNKELRYQFKQIRKVGLLLKTAFKYFNSNGEPDYFAQFLKTFGKLNDTFTRNKGAKFAVKLQAQLESHTFVNFDLQPTDTHEFNERVTATKTEILHLAEKPTIIIPEYHELRKYVRDIKNLFQILAASDPGNNDLLQSFHYLHRLSSDLGSVHDQYAVLKITDRERYTTTELSIPTELLQRILDFFQDDFLR